MAIGDTRLPEGTDSIIAGASAGAGSSSMDDFSSFGAAGGGSTKSKGAASTGDAAVVGDKAASLRDQAIGKAREYADQGKERAVEGLENVQRLIDDAATTVDDKVGEQYGAYIRQAGDTVASFSTMLRDKNVEQLLADTQDLVRRSPGIAIGAAAAIGFAIARVAKAGLDASVADTGTSSGGKAPAKPTGTPSSASADERPSV